MVFIERLNVGVVILHTILTLITQNQQVAQINKQYCKRSSAIYAEQENAYYLRKY